MNTKVGFIGAGNMAGAIISGILSREDHPQLYAFDIDKSKCERFGRSVNYCPSLEELVTACDYLFFAIKPQVIDSVLDQLQHAHVNWTGKTIITMVAGISTTYIAHKLNGSIAIVRIMPNTPVMLGHGATTVCANEQTSPTQLEFVKSLLSDASHLRDIPERQMNASISINGSSPAYLFLFAKSVVDYAKKQGIDDLCALELFAHTMIGSAKMLLESNMDPEALIRMVTSPGGTTLEALKVFENYQFDKIIFDAMAACTKRADELGR